MGLFYFVHVATSNVVILASTNDQMPKTFESNIFSFSNPPIVYSLSVYLYIYSLCVFVSRSIYLSLFLEFGLIRSFWRQSLNADLRWSNPSKHVKTSSSSSSAWEKRITKLTPNSRNWVCFKTSNEPILLFCLKIVLAKFAPLLLRSFFRFVVDCLKIDFTKSKNKHDDVGSSRAVAANSKQCTTRNSNKKNEIYLQILRSVGLLKSTSSTTFGKNNIPPPIKLENENIILIFKRLCDTNGNGTAPKSL